MSFTEGSVRGKIDNLAVILTDPFFALSSTMANGCCVEFLTNNFNTKYLKFDSLINSADLEEENRGISF